MLKLVAKDIHTQINFIDIDRRIGLSYAKECLTFAYQKLKEEFRANI